MRWVSSKSNRYRKHGPRLVPSRSLSHNSATWGGPRPPREGALNPKSSRSYRASEAAPRAQTRQLRRSLVDRAPRVRRLLAPSIRHRGPDQGPTLVNKIDSKAHHSKHKKPLIMVFAALDTVAISILYSLTFHLSSLRRKPTRRR
ncbi:hypothetical protein BHM03_00032922 [Ensete ventricosum]|nr:hypothetical protein BHM03_00032922 [Ensete ventricosum]